MRQIALASVCAGVLVACGGVETHRAAPQELRRLESDFDRAWEATVRVVRERGFEIRTLDRTDGSIQTGWMTINPEYAATVLVTSQEDRYCACGRPNVGQAFRSKQARLEMVLSPLRAEETGLHIAAFFRTQRHTDVPLWRNHPLGEVECNSRGRLEEEIRVLIQLRLLSDRLEQLRRGMR
jgi:hypothetical protein